MLDQERIRSCTRRILSSRMRILNSHGFFGLLLMHMSFSLDEMLGTAATDGNKIVFSPAFMDELSDSELDFVMMHEILHIALLHCHRGMEYNSELFNIACDIVVNSNILKENGMDKASIFIKSIGESMHLTPDGKEGFEFTAEEVYQMLLNEKDRGDRGSHSKDSTSKEQSRSGGNRTDSVPGAWDDHSKWGSIKDEDGSLRDAWIMRVREASSAISIVNSSKRCGSVPDCIKRHLKELREPTIDWRTVLNNFIQSEICDYSFQPPDRRYDSTGFYLPDYNEREDLVENILFMVDTSGSMSDKEISDAFSEIKGAINQFNGKLRGWLGFFDARVVKPTPFSDEEEIKLIKPSGGGGTRFDVIFKYVRENMSENRPSSIIILTDGYAPFPDEGEADGIPVLWVINNDTVSVPWGRVARIKDNEV